MHMSRERDLDPPTDFEIDEVVDKLRRWQYVEPEQRSKLRSAVAALPLIELVAAPVLQIERQYRVGEVAETLRVSTGTVRNLIKSGVLRAYTLSGRKGSEYRIPESSVREYLDTVAKVEGF